MILHWETGHTDTGNVACSALGTWAGLGIFLLCQALRKKQLSAFTVSKTQAGDAGRLRFWQSGSLGLELLP